MRLIPIFVDFVGTGKPPIKCSTEDEFSIGLYADIGKNTTFDIYEHMNVPLFTKVGIKKINESTVSIVILLLSVPFDLLWRVVSLAHLLFYIYMFATHHAR